jgi:shikimate dehydrogenase
VLGSTTDGLALASALEAEGASVLLLGAGGAAQAVATALLDAGASSLTVAARDPERAHALAMRLRSIFPEREVATATGWPPENTAAAIVVNATPVCDELLVEPRPGQTIADLAYRGAEAPTALAVAARERGCPLVDGLDVLAAQGAASFQRWTGVEAPVEVMRAALRSLSA